MNFIGLYHLFNNSKKELYELAEVHKHLLLTGYLTAPLTVDDASKVEDWFVRLVDAVNMNILIRPKVVWCETDGNEGLTGIVCIDTSHSSCHFWDDYFTFDLYSCKDFNLTTVFNLLKEFNVSHIEYDVVDRTSYTNRIDFT